MLVRDRGRLPMIEEQGRTLKTLPSVPSLADKSRRKPWLSEIAARYCSGQEPEVIRASRYHDRTLVTPSHGAALCLR